MSGPITSDDSLVRFAGSSRVRRRLVCLPFAGGGPAAFRLWPRTLPADVEVLAVRLPGRSPSSREPRLDSADAVVDALLPAIRAQADLPYALFGHSMGALLAFELALALEGSGAGAPERLFVSGRCAPDEPSTSLRIHALPDAEFLAQLDKNFAGVPEVVRNEPDLLALLLPALRADVRVYETYEPLTDRQVACPVHVYGGVDDRHPRPSELAGWQRVAEGAISVRLFPGDHFYLTNEREALTADIGQRWTGVDLRAAPS
jgi:medium-chain acyl-[acyl-carrier-protein] hydrolase